MVNGTVNRISGFLGDAPESPTVRSPAQIEASRRNGAQSNGPVTAAGKERSRLNSLKHGVFARVIAPPTDARREDRLYWKFRQALLDELKPTKFSDFNVVDSVALDLVQLARVRKMTETLQQPESLTERESQQWAQIQDQRRNLRAAENILKSLKSHRPLACPYTEAAILAALIKTQVQQIVDDQAQVDADAAELARVTGAAGQPPSNGGVVDPSQNDSQTEADWEEQELRQLQASFDFIKPAADRLRDEAYVAGILHGGQKAKRGDLPRLARLLEEWCVAWRKLQRQNKGLEKRLLRSFDRKASSLAESPHQLMLLFRYQRQIENAIDKKMHRLKRE